MEVELEFSKAQRTGKLLEKGFASPVVKAGSLA